MAIKVLGIDHIVLRTSKLDAMLGFYQGILGCPVERELPEEVGLVQLRAGSALIDLVPVNSKLGKMGGKAPRQDGRNMDHLCLLVAAMEESKLREQLGQAGIEVGEFAERYGAEGFGRSVYVHDPEGNVVELKLARPGTLRQPG